VVSAGGGIVGAPLFKAALAAQGELWETERLPMTVVAGPFHPEDDWDALRRAAQDRPGLELHHSVPDLGVELRDAAASVSQCGYNTAMDILYSGVPALFVPFAKGREDEQTNRARRLEKLGLVRVLEPGRLDGPALAREIRAILRFRPKPAVLDLNGAGNTARLVWRMVADRQVAGQTAVPPPKRTGGRP
jgi:predicted glycosyltransferase